MSPSYRVPRPDRPHSHGYGFMASPSAQRLQKVPRPRTSPGHGRKPSRSELQYMIDSDIEAVRVAKRLMRMSRQARVAWINALLERSRGKPLERRRALLIQNLVEELRRRNPPHDRSGAGDEAQGSGGSLGEARTRQPADARAEEAEDPSV